MGTRIQPMSSPIPANIGLFGAQSTNSRIGDIAEYIQEGAGQLTLVASQVNTASPMGIIVLAPGSGPKTNGQYTSIKTRYLGDNTYLVSGGVA